MKLGWNSIIGLAVVGLVAVLFVRGGQNRAEPAVLSDNIPSDGVVTVENDAHDFGTISMGDGDVVHVYELKNRSSEPVTLGEIYTSCMCTTAQAKYEDGTESKVAGMRGHGAATALNRAIQPGESFQVEAVFDPAAHGPSGVGPVNRVVYVQTNSREKQMIELKFEATVVR